MAIEVSVFTIGGGDLFVAVFNSVASIFNSKATIATITSLAIMFGGICAVFEFAKSKDIATLIKWVGIYILVTSLILYPKATVIIEDRTGFDEKPRVIDHVPLSLALFAGFTSRIGIGFTEVIETVFHMPNDLTYNKTGMLMGARLVLAAKHFQITDSEFSETLNDFMQQCVFFDLLLRKYSVDDLLHASNPWGFIKVNTSKARAFPLKGKITACNIGAGALDEWWKTSVNQAASIYAGQIIGNSKEAAGLLLSHLSDCYQFLTKVSSDGNTILQTNLLANAISNGITRFGANTNAYAALQAYQDTKSELTALESMNQAASQSAVWMQYYKNIIEAVLYAAFLIVYFLSYFPFGMSVIRNYLLGLFILQTLAPLYAIINFAANFFAQNRAMAFISTDPSHGDLSIANIVGITQANAEAMAVAGYLIWPVTIGGAVMLFRGLPGFIQNTGQFLGGVVQHSSTQVVSESIGGNINAGNASFGNKSLNNMNANHWDSNLRYASGASTFQTGTGSSITITPQGNEVLNNQGGMSQLAVNVQVAESNRAAASSQAQMSYTAGLNKLHSAGQQYSAGLRALDDYAKQEGHNINSGTTHSYTETSGVNHAANSVSQLIESFAKEHHVSHERAAQVLGQVYADVKVGQGLGFIVKGEVGASASLSASGRSAFGSLYNDAHRFAKETNFSETVDSAERAAIDTSFRDQTDKGNRLIHSITSSFDKGNSYRTEAASQLSISKSYSDYAQTTSENASTINANYTQSFFEWMRHQKSPSSQYGQGTFSQSAIDHMAIYEPEHLQQYADQFVKLKTNEAMSSFAQSHHLTDGKEEIFNSYQQSNQEIPGKSHIANAYRHDQNVIKQHDSDMKHVDENIREHVNQQMNHNKNTLNQKEQVQNQGAEPLKEHIKQKVKGQVLGSIDPSHNSLAEIMERNKSDNNTNHTGFFPFNHNDKREKQGD